MTDRTSKALLVLIAIGLWGVLLRPLFTSTPARAQVVKASDDYSQPPTAPEKGATVLAIRPGEKIVVADSVHIAAYTLDTKNKLVLLDNENWDQVNQAASPSAITKAKAK